MLNVVCEIISVEQRKCRDDASMKRLAAVLTHLPKKKLTETIMSSHATLSV